MPAYYEDYLKKQYPEEYRNPVEAFRKIDQTTDFPEMSRLLSEVQNYRGDGIAAKLFYESKVAEALSLVGYDNVSYAAIPRIHLTTVSQHKFQQGRIAVERLLCQIQGDRRPTADLLQPELVVRSTCAPRTQGGRTL